MKVQLITLPDGIWYAEEGQSQMFIAIVRIQGNDTFASIIANNRAEAKETLEKTSHGEVLLIKSIAETLSAMIEVPGRYGNRIL